MKRTTRIDCPFGENAECPYCKDFECGIDDPFTECDDFASVYSNREDYPKSDEPRTVFEEDC